MTKNFLYGRTEAMRPVSMNSKTFVEHPTLENLKVAADEHIKRIKECKRGQGIDRHLYGLLRIHKLNHSDDTMPNLFKSPAYLALTDNKISTSTSRSDGIYLAGYGPSVNDGYAARYLVYPNEIHYMLSSKSHQENNLNAFHDNLEIALNEMIML
jgi:carnitine O-acetyltransferase